MINNRFTYLLAALLTIGLGLWSRRLGWLPAEIGDGLWAVLVYLSWRFLQPNGSKRRAGFMALLLSFAVECSQLLRWEWLVALRQTVLGHLLLGQGFLVADLLAYVLGIMAALAIDTKMVNHKRRTT